MEEASQRSAALDLRLAQAAERNREPEEPIEEEPEMSLRERHRLARNRADAKRSDGKSVVNKSEGAQQGMKFITARLLRAAWMSEGTIVGFLLGLVYINLHVFLRIVIGHDMFCKLGEEWSLGKAGPAGKTASAGAFWAEAIQLLLFDLLIVGVVAFVVFWLYLFAQLITSPWETAKLYGLDFFQGIWDMINLNSK